MEPLEPESGAPGLLDRIRGDRTVRVVMAVGGVIAVVLAVRSVVSRWNDASALELDLSGGAVAAALLAVVAANTVLAGSWAWLLGRLGHGLAPVRAFQVWWTGQLGTYLPTGLGSVPARVVLASRYGVPRRIALASSALEPIAIILVCGIDAALLLDGPAAVALVLLGLIGAVGALTLALRAARSRSGDATISSPFATAVGYVGAQQVQVAVRAAGLWAGLTVVDPLARPSLWHLLGVVGASYFVGFMVVFAPGGLGAREATMTALLTGTTGAPAALAAAVAWRLLEILVVLPSVAVANVTVRVRAP